MPEYIMHFGAVRIRATGSGSLKSTLYSLSDVYSQALTDLTLATTNNIQPILLANFTQQRASLLIKTTAIDEYFNIRRIEIYVKPVATGTPQ